MYEAPPEHFKDKIRDIHFIYSHHAKVRAKRFKMIAIGRDQIRIDIRMHLDTMEIDSSSTVVRIIGKRGIYVISVAGMIVTTYIRNPEREKEYKDKMKYRKLSPQQKAIIRNNRWVNSKERFYNQESPL